MAFGVPNKSLDNSPHVISIEVGEKFYEELQGQMDDAVSSMSPDQRIALLLVLLGFSLLSELRPNSPSNAEQDERSFVWNYLSQLQKELPEGKTFSDVLLEANIQLVVNGKPLEIQHPAKSADHNADDPFENFKQGWDDAMQGRTMTFEEFERRMLEDAD